MDWNPGHDHEVMHLCHVIGEMWDAHVVETATAGKYSDVKAAAEEIAEKIADLYQLVGRKWDATLSAERQSQEASR